MSSIEQQSKVGSKQDVRYLTPLDIETKEVKKCQCLYSYHVNYFQDPQMNY